LRHYDASRKVAVSIPDDVIGIFFDIIFPVALWPWGRLRFNLLKPSGFFTYRQV
jgi:hypothetical protein